MFLRRWTIPASVRRTSMAGAAVLIAASASFGQATSSDPQPPATDTQRVSSLDSDDNRQAPERDPATVADAIAAAADWATVERILQDLSSPETQDLRRRPEVTLAIANRLSDAPYASLASTLDFCRSSGQRDVVRAVIAILSDPDAAAVHDHVMRTLGEQTGRDDLGTDQGAWLAWWAEHEWIPEAEWLRRVASWQAERARRMAERTVAAEKSRADLFREVYSLTPADQRPVILIRLLEDDAADVRRLGLELANRAVVNATPLPPEVTDTAATLLRDETPDIRASAARLLASAGLNGASADVSAALSRERDPRAAKSMIEALAFSAPSRGDLEAAILWIEHPVVRSVAARLLVVGDERGLLQSPRLRNAAFEAVQADMGVSCGPSGVMLFGRLASAQSFQQLTVLFTHENDAIRTACAEALALRPSGMDALLERCVNDPTVARITIRAAILWSPDMNAWRTLSAIPDLDVQMIAALANALPAETAIQAVNEDASGAHVGHLLRRFSPEDETFSRLRPRMAREGLSKRLVHLLETGAYEQVAIETRVARTQAPTGVAESVVIHRSYRVSLLCLEQIDEAIQSGVTSDEWFDAIRRTTDRMPETASRLVDALQRQDSMSLTSAEAARLGEIADELTIQSGGSGGANPGDSEQPGAPS